MEIKVFVTEYLKSNMYLVTENGHALLIDPSENAKLLKMLNKNKTALDHILLTHEHYDHINGVNWWKEKFPLAEVFCSEPCAERIQNPRANSSRYFEAFCQIQTWTKNQKPMPSVEYICHADKTYSNTYFMEWHGHKLRFQEAAGHSPGSSLIFLDENILFSGDSLSKDYVAATRFPGGNTEIYNSETLPKLMSLPENTLVYPGHMKAFKISECLTWKNNN